MTAAPVRSGLLRLGLAALVLFFAVDAAMRLLEHRLLPQAAPAAVRPGASGPRDAAADVAAIVRANIFGKAALGKAADAGRASAPKAAPGLGLELLGTVSAQENGLGAVILDREAGRQGYFRLAEAVRPGLTLVAVRRFAAILRGPGGEVSLAMAEPGAARTQEPGAAEPLEQPAAQAEDRVVRNVRLRRADVEKAATDLSQVLRDMKLTPVQHDDAPAFRLDNFRTSGLAGKLALRRGDIIVGLNGQAITGPEQLVELYAGGASQAVVNIVRGGKAQDIALTVEDDGAQ